MKQYKTVNNLVGWITFLIAATVYCMTIEPTASFWDCPEFITTGYKLEVGHPPGAPFFMLVANLFSQFASDASTVAKMVNYSHERAMSGAWSCSFLSITHLVRKLVVTDENNITRGQMVLPSWVAVWWAHLPAHVQRYPYLLVQRCGRRGMSALLTVHCRRILAHTEMGGRCQRASHSDRWLILIAYLTGLRSACTC